MKRHLFFHAICLWITLQACPTQACQYRNETTVPHKTDIALYVPKMDDAKAIEFIKDFYTNCVFGKPDYIPILKKHCTPKLLKELKANYGYDGESYAIWNFRTGAQDGPSNVSKVTSVTALGNGFYKVNFIDMGIEGNRTLKIVNAKGILKFAAIK